MGIGSSVLPVARSGFNRVMGFAMAIILALLLVSGIQRPAMANPKFAAITVDAATGEIIYGHDIDEARYPASLTKVMTLYILFQEIQANRLRFDTHMKVSRKAAAQQPSKLGLRAGRTITVRDAMYALITKSANDAAMVIAEHISGSQEAFADRMTKTARALGMTKTRFTNPERPARSAARSRPRATWPPWACACSATSRATTSSSRPAASSTASAAMATTTACLAGSRGVDGIKTGYTRASGFNLLSSMEVNKRRHGGRGSRWQDGPVAQRVHDQDPAPRHCKGNPLKQSHRSGCRQAQGLQPGFSRQAGGHGKAGFTHQEPASSTHQAGQPCARCLLPAATVSATAPGHHGRNAETGSQG
jgi:D-alanyl-D-alanine carboxypeptidase